MRHRLGLITLLCLAAGLLNGCAGLEKALNLEKPKAYLRGVQFDKIDINSATLLFDVEIENPYTVDLPLLDMDYNLTSRGDKFLAGQADIQSIIPAKEKRTVSLPATIRYADFTRAIKGLRPGAKVPYKADVAVAVNAPVLGRLRLPLSKEGELAIPTLADLPGLLDGFLSAPKSAD